MEIINPRCSGFSNLEVLESLRKIQDCKKKPGLRNLATVKYETLLYLEDSPCKNQTREGITTFLKEIAPYKLTKKECLMMVNDPPTTPLHIQLVVEDSEERLTEEQVEQILELIAKHLITENSE